MVKFELSPHPLETQPQNEDEQIRECADLMVQLLERRYPRERVIRRGVHPKDHGCVRAVFQVNADLSKNLQVGVFKTPGRKYDAWIRFSNAAALVGPDVDRPDGGATLRHASRGMAIKLMGVDGKVFFPDEGANTQDFLMVNFPVFPFANVGDYLELNRALLLHNDNQKLSFGAFGAALGKQGPEAGARAVKAGQISGQIQAAPVANPLEAQYFSAAPFLFGADRVMKYSAKPCDATKSPLPDHPSDNYLREALTKQVGEKETTFDFLVQVRPHTDGKADLAIEDVTVEWKDDVMRHYEYEPVARITIPIQESDTPAARAVCEDLFFTPWHSLLEHRPLGGINRLRREVYFASSRRRHHPKEPTGREAP